MKTVFISRHAGAKVWLTEQGFKVDAMWNHLHLSQIETGDCIVGTLPVQLVAQINQIGACYFHLSLDLPVEARGRELSATDMVFFKARLQAFRVEELDIDMFNFLNED